jgi:RNase adapter protein RapZ
MRVVIITGISGSGKSVALNELEDDGYYCIDNLPAQFVLEVVMNLQEQGIKQAAIAVDARSQSNMEDLKQVLAGMNRFGHDVKVLFLNARNETLIHRFSETRRRHPLAIQANNEESSLQAPAVQQTLFESIENERELLSELENIGAMIDTSDMHPNVLRQWVRETVGASRSHITLSFVSFAFKHGVPLDADLVFDVRCLPNPYYQLELRPLTGKDEPVAQYLSEIPSVGRMIDHIANFVNTWLPFYIQENRSYLTVAIGCTGGQHRSVYCVEKIGKRFSRTEVVLIRHRAMASRAHQKQH